MSRSRLLSLFLLGGLLLGSAGSASGAPMPKEALERVRQLAVQHGGRLKPLDSFSWEVLDRLTGEPRWRNQHPVDTVLSIAADPGRWQKEPLIAVPFVPLREALGLNRKTSHVSYSQLAEEKTLVQMLPGIAAKQRQNEKLTMLENEAMDAYDRFALLTALFTQELHLVPPLGEEKIWLPILAPAGYSPEKRQALQSAWKGFLAVLREGRTAEADSAADRLASELETAHPGQYPPGWRLHLEILYNDLAPFRIARVVYALAAALLLIFALGRTLPWLRNAGVGLLWAALLIHGAGIVTRVVLGGRPPVSNFYETMLWLPFVGVILTLVFERIYRAGTFGFAGGLLAGLALLLADHLPLDPSISPVAAVLRSNLWLTIHVLTIVGSYAPLSLAAVLAHVYGGLYLARGGRHPGLALLNIFLYRLIQVGVVLLAAGIMLGAVWANASWGRYWGWDPKETWSLITLLWFLALLHGRFAGWLRGVGFSLGIVAGFLLLLMTYYGVSFYLAGLHSYAGGHAKPLPPPLAAYVAAEVAFVAAVTRAVFRERKRL